VSHTLQSSTHVPTLAESGYVGNPPYHYVDSRLAPVVFMWWATTAAGRQSKYLVTCDVYRLCDSGKLAMHDGHPLEVVVPSPHYHRNTRALYDWLRQRGTIPACPRLRRGYVWHGPFLYDELAPPQAEGPYDSAAMFRLRAPEQSDGNPIQFDAGPLAAARALAIKLLSQRMPSA
jgi:hypothetical protein